MKIWNIYLSLGLVLCFLWDGSVMAQSLPSETTETEKIWPDNFLDLYPSKDVKLLSASETLGVPVSKEEMNMIGRDFFSNSPDLLYSIQRMKVIARATGQEFNLETFVKQVKDVMDSILMVSDVDPMTRRKYASTIFRRFALTEPAKRDIFFKVFNAQDVAGKRLGLLAFFRGEEKYTCVLEIINIMQNKKTEGASGMQDTVSGIAGVSGRKRIRGVGATPDAIQQIEMDLVPDGLGRTWPHDWLKDIFVKEVILPKAEELKKVDISWTKRDRGFTEYTEGIISSNDVRYPLRVLDSMVRISKGESAVVDARKRFVHQITWVRDTFLSKMKDNCSLTILQRFALMNLNRREMFYQELEKRYALYKELIDSGDEERGRKAQGEAFAGLYMLFKSDLKSRSEVAKHIRSVMQEKGVWNKVFDDKISMRGYNDGGRARVMPPEDECGSGVECHIPEVSFSVGCDSPLCLPDSCHKVMGDGVEMTGLSDDSESTVSGEEGVWQPLNPTTLDGDNYVRDDSPVSLGRSVYSDSEMAELRLGLPPSYGNEEDFSL